MLITKKAYLAAALTSASLAALAMPTSAWAQATPNVTDECAPAIESSAGLNPEAFDPVTGAPLNAGDIIPDAVQCGIGATASGNGALAIGNGANAAFADSTVIGTDASAAARNATAIGARAQALFENSVAIGADSIANEDGTVSFGKAADPVTGLGGVTRRLTNVANGTAATDAVNVGQLNAAVLGVVAGVNPLVSFDTTTGPVAAFVSAGSNAMAIGSGSEAAGGDSVAVGKATVATGDFSVALGSDSLAQGNESVALGNKAKAESDRSTAVGASAEVTDLFSSAVGAFAKADGVRATAFGDGALSEGLQTLAVGSDAKVNATDRGIAIGGFANVAAGATGSIALGADSNVAAGVFDAVAIGSDAVADRANTVSFGAGVDAVAGVPVVKERQLVNVAAGTAATDAVNKGQLDAATVDDRLVAFGAFSAFALPASAPGGTVSAAAAAVGANSIALGDGAVTNGANTVAIGLLANTGNTSGSVALGAGSRALADNVVSVGSGSAADAATFQFRKIVNVANGTAANDAVNKAQLDGSFTAANTDLTGVIDGKLTSSNTVFADAVADVVGTLGVGGAGNDFLAIDTTNFSTAASAGADSVALGGNSNASGLRSVALGSGSVASADNVVSVGSGDPADAGTIQFRKIVNVANGTAANDAVNKAQLDGSFTAANTDLTAVIDGRFDITANSTFSNAVEGVVSALGIGGAGNAFVDVNPNVVGGVVSADADASVAGSVAIGGAATASAANSVALGEGSVADVADTVSVGNATLKRKIVNVADGSANSDAATVGQLNTATAVNKFVGIDRTNFTANSIVGTDAVALGAGTNAAGLRSVAIGNGSITASGDTDVVSFGGSDKPGGAAGEKLTRRLTNVAAGTGDNDATNLGQVKLLIANAGVSGGVVVPANVFVAVKEVAGAAPAEAAVAGTIALGGGSKATLAGAVAVGEGATASAGNAAAFGAGANVGANALNSVALGSGSVASEANAVSIGSGKTGDAFATRKLVNVTAGTADTDAVNVAQLNAVKSDLKLATDDIGILKGDVLALKNAANTGGAGGGFLAVKPATGAAAAVADKDGAIALGGNALAATENAVAIGTGATAKDGAAVSIGLGNTASGNGAVAIGDPNTATGQGAVALGFTNTATGLAAVALGSESQAVGDSAFAQGNKSAALGLSAVAIGEGARSALDKPTAGSTEAFAASNIAIGRAAAATAQTTIAIGNGAIANDEDATVVGDKSQAGFHATAIGGEVIASGRGSQAFGWQTNATGNLSTALGFRTNAVGAASLAVGANARSDFANSSAIGTGAVTTRDNQIVLGRKASTSATGVVTPGTSVTIADIAASTAAQSGPTDVMTVDASGTIGRDPSIRASISTLNGQVANLQKGQEELFDLVSFNRKEARRGIAAASALTAAPMPSEPGKTSFVAGTAFYRGEGAFSMSFNHRLNLDIPVAFGGGFAHSGGKDTVVRAHVATEF